MPVQLISLLVRQSLNIDQEQCQNAGKGVTYSLSNYNWKQMPAA
jgi:hypothetical protein